MPMTHMPGPLDTFLVASLPSDPHLLDKNVVLGGPVMVIHTYFQACGTYSETSSKSIVVSYSSSLYSKQPHIYKYIVDLFHSYQDRCQVEYIED